MGREDAILGLEAPIGSALYAQALALREAVLRQPLGLTLSGEELEDDKLRTHLCAVEDGEVVVVWAVAVLNRQPPQPHPAARGRGGPRPGPPAFGQGQGRQGCRLRSW